MKKHIILLVLLISAEWALNAQQSIVDSNTMLLNTLEARFKSPCIRYEEQNIKKSVIKADKKVINSLNKIYQFQGNLTDLLSLLKKNGYSKSAKIYMQGEIIDTVVYEIITEGQLDGYVEITFNVEEQQLLEKKIKLETKKRFFCETKELWSIFSVDFVYIRRFISRIKIPLQVSWSNAFLESK